MSESTLRKAAKEFLNAVSQIDFSAIPGGYDSIPFATLEAALKSTDITCSQPTQHDLDQ